MGAMLTPKQCASRTNTSLSLIYQKIAEGELVAHRFGKRGCRGCLRIAEDDLDDWIRRSRSPPPGGGDDDDSPMAFIK